MAGMVGVGTKGKSSGKPIGRFTLPQGPAGAEDNPTRQVLEGSERYRSPGPASMAGDAHPPTKVLYHGRVEGTAALDMVYENDERVMAGREHPEQVDDLNSDLNAGSHHLQMPPAPHKEEM